MPDDNDVFDFAAQVLREHARTTNDDDFGNRLTATCIDALGKRYRMLERQCEQRCSQLEQQVAALAQAVHALAQQQKRPEDDLSHVIKEGPRRP